MQLNFEQIFSWKNSKKVFLWDVFGLKKGAWNFADFTFWMFSSKKSRFFIFCFSASWKKSTGTSFFDYITPRIPKKLGSHRHFPSPQKGLPTVKVQFETWKLFHRFLFVKNNNQFDIYLKIKVSRPWVFEVSETFLQVMEKPEGFWFGIAASGSKFVWGGKKGFYSFQALFWRFCFN